MFAKSLVLLSIAAAAVVANGDAHCKCFMHGTGWNLSGDSKTVCSTIRDATYNGDTQECVIGGGNKYGADLFDTVCFQHFGYSNCKQGEKKLQRREAMETRRTKKGGKELANCQCTETILGNVDVKSSQEACESIASVKWDKHLESCRIDPMRDLQLEEFRRYCALFFRGSSC